MANAGVLDALEAECEEQLKCRQARVGIAGVVRERLERVAGVVPGLGTVAADLSYAPRTLRRLLAAEGRSFSLWTPLSALRSRRLLLDDMRMDG